MYKVILQKINREELENDEVLFDSDTFRESFLFASMKAEEFRFKSGKSCWMMIMPEDDSDEKLIIMNGDERVQFNVDTGELL